MKVAIISPYYKESMEEIKRCMDSVTSQTHPCTHILVSDGNPKDELDKMDVVHIRLPNHADYGDTPRALAAMSAAARGFDAVAFLDADNWYEPNHIASLITLCKHTGATIATSGRMLRRPDGSILAPCPESDGKTFNDTNCYLITHGAFGLFPVWTYKEKNLACIGDRVFWNAVLNSGCKRAHSDNHSVNYVTLFANHYLNEGETPPPGAKVLIKSKDGKQFTVAPYDNKSADNSTGKKQKNTRQQIVSDYLQQKKIRKLHIGCGSNILDGWLNADYYPVSETILHLDATKRFPIGDNEFSYVFSEHMIEHISYSEGLDMLSECFRIMKNKGKIRISTPDLSFLIDLYNDKKSDLQARYIQWATDNFVKGAPYCDEVFVINNFVRDWGHQFIYDEEALRSSLAKAGFTNITKCKLNHSDVDLLRNLECETRMPKDFLELESFTLEAEKLVDK